MGHVGRASRRRRAVPSLGTVRDARRVSSARRRGVPRGDRRGRRRRRVRRRLFRWFFFFARANRDTKALDRLRRGRRGGFARGVLFRARERRERRVGARRDARLFQGGGRRGDGGRRTRERRRAPGRRFRGRSLKPPPCGGESFFGFFRGHRRDRRRKEGKKLSRSTLRIRRRWRSRVAPASDRRRARRVERAYALAGGGRRRVARRRRARERRRRVRVLLRNRGAGRGGVRHAKREVRGACDEAASSPAGRAPRGRGGEPPVCEASAARRRLGARRRGLRRRRRGGFGGRRRRRSPRGDVLRARFGGRRTRRGRRVRLGPGRVRGRRRSRHARGEREGTRRGKRERRRASPPRDAVRGFGGDGFLRRRDARRRRRGTTGGSAPRGFRVRVVRVQDRRSGFRNARQEKCARRVRGRARV